MYARHVLLCACTIQAYFLILFKDGGTAFELHRCGIASYDPYFVVRRR